MGDLFFFLKCLVMTFFFVILMQVKIGKFTIEERMMFWIHDSPVTEPLQDVARGGIRALREGWKGIRGQFKDNIAESFQSENLPGSRQIQWKLERSKEYLKGQAEKAAKKVQEQTADEAKKESPAARP